MKQSVEKIEFYKERSLGEKLNATFEFIYQNWKIILKYFNYICLPFAFIQALCYEVITDRSMLENVVSGSPVHLLIFFLSAIGIFIVSVVWSSLFYGFLQVYNNRKEGLEGIVFADLKSYFFTNIRKLTLFGLVFCLYGILFGILKVLSIYIALVFFLAVLVCLFPLLLSQSVLVFEEISIGNAIKRGLNLGFKNYGGLLGFGLVLFVIVIIVCYLPSIPSVILDYFKTNEDTDAVMGSGFLTSTPFVIVHYVFYVLRALGCAFASGIFCIGFSYQFSHSAEKEGTGSSKNEIEHFDEMTDNNEDAVKQESAQKVSDDFDKL